MSSPLHLPNIGGIGRESHDYRNDGGGNGAVGTGLGDPANPGPFLMGKKIIMVAKTSGSPSSGKSSGSPRSSSPTKERSGLGTGTGSDSKVSSSSSSGRPKSGNNAYDKNKNSPAERLKQCASPLKARTRTSVDAGGAGVLHRDVDRDPASSNNPWERSHSLGLGGSPGHSVTVSAPPLHSASASASASVHLQSSAAERLNDALGTATTARGNPINVLTRTSVNSLRKSKIPAPASASLRKSLDTAGSSSTESSTGSLGKTSLFSSTAPANLMTSSSAGSSRSGGGGARAVTSLNLENITSGNSNADGNNSNTKSKTLKTRQKLQNRPRAGSDVSDSKGSDTDTASIKSGASNSSGGSSNSAMVKSLVATTGATQNASASSFQNACKARVALQKKALQLALRSSVDSAHAHNSSRDMHAAIKEATANQELEKKKRNRAEVYAINAFLKNMEIERFTIFLKEQQEKESNEGDNDDISWCTADSSVMPTPRYRSEKERNYAGSPSKRSAAAGGV